jgi:hypothetical protein
MEATNKPIDPNEEILYLKFWENSLKETLAMTKLGIFLPEVLEKIDANEK